MRTQDNRINILARLFWYHRMHVQNASMQLYSYEMYDILIMVKVSY